MKSAGRRADRVREDQVPRESRGCYHIFGSAPSILEYLPYPWCRLRRARQIPK